MVVMSVRDQEPRRADVEEAVGRRPWPAPERAQSIRKQGVGQDVRPIEIEEDGRMTEESDAA